MTNRIPLAALTILSGVLVAGCGENKSTTGPYVTPDVSASHYNPVVNDTGARTGTDDPAIHPPARPRSTAAACE